MSEIPTEPFVTEPKTPETPEERAAAKSATPEPLLLEHVAPHPKTESTPHQSHASDSASKKSRHHYKLGILLIVLIAIGVWGVFSRIETATKLKKETDDEAIPHVVVMAAPRSAASEEVVLPGTVQAWHEAPIYARTSGYLKNWNVDIGGHVKAGDVLAEIETPEVDAQLHQAEADLNTAKANNILAQSTTKRWQDLLKTHSVSQQEADEKSGGAAAASANMAAAQANLDRLQQLEDFKTVIAPFDGIITARNTDKGALINAGSNGTGLELFHIADTSKLRIYVQVPENYAESVTPDMKADLHFPEYPNRTFEASLEHSADALDPTTRTLLIQLVADNSDGQLMPGSYAETHLKLSIGDKSVHLPVSTLLFRGAGMQVATVTDNIAHLKTITIGRDYGKEVEVLTGVDADEMVINNPPDSLADGQKVQAATVEEIKAQKEKASKKDGDKGDKNDGDSKGDSK